MCDEFTEAENEAYLARKRLNRRDFTIAGASVAAIAVVPGCMAKDQPKASGSGAASPGLETVSGMVTVETPDGKADAFWVHPKTGKHPAVLMWPDIAGLRPAFHTMATRLAAAGYAVLAVNQYYRSAPAPVLASFADWRTDAGQAKLRPMIAAITPDRTTSDGGAFVAWLDKQPQVDTAKKVGTVGYCMGGPFTVRTAVSTPDRVGAACSMHGANLVSDDPQSPVKLLGKTRAAYLFAIGQNDDERQPDAKTALRQAADAAHLHAEIEVYPANHGWCVIDTPVYDHDAAERAWSRMLATYQTYL
ncbi:MAG: dienelactone hydrolase family protein [Sphingomonadales bacterium]|nr:dienelactone hydrolase family protein [Sphingomonadales bacterium]MDE2567453.1 dienelactone hydrolase family protein [Sphingomonadales bacterium]